MKGKSVTLPVSLQCPTRISHHQEWRPRAALSLIFGKSLKNIATRVAILIIVHPTVANAGQPGLPTCPASYPYGNSCSRHDGLSVLDHGIQFARRFQASNLYTAKDLLIQKFGKKLACKGIFIEAIGSGDLQSAMRKLDCDIGQDRIERAGTQFYQLLACTKRYCPISLGSRDSLCRFSAVEGNSLGPQAHYDHLRALPRPIGTRVDIRNGRTNPCTIR
jgi:hypothetical protein